MVGTAQPTTSGATLQFDISIEGSDLGRSQAEIYEAIEEIVVDENLHLPAMLAIRIHVNNHDWLSSNLLAEGKTIEVAARQSQGPSVILFKGQIAAVELDMDEQEPVITIRAYDASFKLHRIHARRSFLNTTDSDVARKLAQEAGFDGGMQVDSTPTVYEYLFQNNQSNYDFLRERSLRIGFDFYCEDGKFFFIRPFQTTGSTRTLKYGEGLRRFRVRTSLFEPANEVSVHGWDIKTKQPIVGSASSQQGLPGNLNGASTAQSAYNRPAKYAVTDRVVEIQGEATTLAQAYLDELSGSFIEAEGVCFGDPALRPRRVVKIEGVGDRFSLEYTITATRHSYTTRDGHQTWFTISSRRDGTVRELVDPHRPQPTWPGPVVGLVTNINDPENMGRIKVKLPTLGKSPENQDNESHWARIATPFAGHNRGFNFLPEINDEVLVVFEQGDMRRPIIVGNVWNGRDAPPKPKALPRGRDTELLKGGSAVKQRLIRSTKDNMLIFNDSDDKPGIILLGTSGAFIMVDDQSGDERITILDKTGNNRIEIRSQDNSIHVLSNGDINVDTKANLKATVQGNADVTVQGNTTVTNSGNITLRATGNIDIQATGNLTLQGMQVSVSAQSTADFKGLTTTVEGSATANLKGGMVNVNATGPAAVKGNPVAIN